MSLLTEATEGPAGHPEGNPGMEKGQERSWGGSARAGQPRVPCAMCRGVGEAAEPSPLPVPGGQGDQDGTRWGLGQPPERGSWAAGRELELCPTKSRSTEQPWGWRDLCNQSADSSQGGKTQPG